jgi:hypothetical protein
MGVRLGATLRGRSWLKDPDAGEWLGVCAWLAVWWCIAFLAIALFGRPIGRFDEAISLVGGQLVHQGYRPQVDFWCLYPPGSFYLTAAGIEVFGQTVLGYRCWSVLLCVPFLLCTARFFSNEFPHSRRLIPGAVLLVALAVVPNIALQVWPAFAVSWLALMTYLVAWRGPEAGRLWKIALSGLLAGVALLMRVNFGLYVPAVVVCDLVLVWLFKTKAGQSRVGRGSVLAAGALFAAPLLLSNTIFYACLYGRNTGLVLAQTVLAAQKLVSAHRFAVLDVSAGTACSLAFPMLWFAIRLLAGADRLAGKWLVPAALGCALAGAGFAIRHQPAIALYIPALEIALIAAVYVFVLRLGRSEMCVLLLYTFLLHYYLSRADAWHVAPLQLVGATLVPYLFFSPPGTPAGRRRFSTLGRAFAVIVAAACAFPSIAGLQPLASDFKTGIGLLANGFPDGRVSDGQRILYGAPAGPWALLCDRSDEREALRFVRSKTSPADPIFVGVADHSRLFWNDVRAYWLADRPVGARYLMFDPGIVTEAPAQTEIIADLERRKVQYALIDHEALAAIADRTFIEHGYVGCGLLDEYLASHFRETARFGEFTVLGRVVP